MGIRVNSLRAGAIALTAAACLVLPEPSAATWSVVAVDPETGEVGLAAATCNNSVQFIAQIVPGMGVVAAQGETSFRGRDLAQEWIARGLGAAEILGRLSEPALYDRWLHSRFPDLQYGVATLSDHHPEVGFTSGSRLSPWAGGRTGPTYSVQGNSLRSQQVIEAAATAFEQQEENGCRLSLAERLLRSLEAGRDAGGDKRCPESRPCLSAILHVAGPEQGAAIRLVSPREISLARLLFQIVVPPDPGPQAPDPVEQLRSRYSQIGRSRCQE